MSGNKEDEKIRILALFRALNNCTLPFGVETTVQSIEEFFEANGYITPKQQGLLIDYRERYE